MLATDQVADMVNQKQHVDKFEAAYEKGISMVEKINLGGNQNISSNMGYLTDLVAVIPDDSLKNTLTQTLSIATKITDIGKSVPFVAPIFAVLNVLIAIEANARAADAKCKDLIERINFMLSHLTTLDDIKLLSATEQVIERMRQVIQNAAVLIQAYRKQSPIARRLNVSNKSSFISCCESIKSCSDDLLFSLQIHQTNQMDILSRALTQDPADASAEKFIKEHGGIDAVKNDPALVAEFAKGLKLTMDDSVMKELNSNIADLLKENQAQVEKIMKDSVGTAFIDGFKNLAKQMAEFENEPLLSCVQCGEDYKNSVNPPGGCSFHQNPWKNGANYYCCGSTDPCKKNVHRNKHHAEFKYASYRQRAADILGYTDTQVEWTSITEKNFEDSELHQSASCGQLLRLKSRSSFVEEPSLYVSIDSQGLFFFEIYTAKDLLLIESEIHKSGDSIIAANGDGEKGACRVEWCIDQAKNISGIRLTVKSATSSNPAIRVVNFDRQKFTIIGEPNFLAYGFEPFMAENSYNLAPAKLVGAPLMKTPVRSVRKDFKTVKSAGFKLVMMVTSDPPLMANEKWSSGSVDTFSGIVSLFNGSSEHIVIASYSAAYRLIGDEVYSDPETCEFHQKLPLVLEPFTSKELGFDVRVPRSPIDIAKNVTNWFNRAFVARHQPLRLKISVSDLDERKASLVLDYVFKAYAPDGPNDNDLATLYIDDPDTFDRTIVHCYPDSYSKGIYIGNHCMDEDRLKKIVYESMKSGHSEYDLSINQDAGEKCFYNIWALVDFDCQRVYGFKVLLKQKDQNTRAAMAYVRVPNYGQCPIKRRNRYAVESVPFPNLDEEQSINTLVDDDFDNVVIAEGPEPIAKDIREQIQPDFSKLEAKLESIDKNLTNTAQAIQALTQALLEFTKVQQQKQDQRKK